MADFIFVIIELVLLSLTVETLYVEISRSWRFSKGVGHFWWIFDREGSIAHQPVWCQKTRAIAILCGIIISAVHHLVLSQYTHLMDRQIALHYMPHCKNWQYRSETTMHTFELLCFLEKMNCWFCDCVAQIFCCAMTMNWTHDALHLHCTWLRRGRRAMAVFWISLIWMVCKPVLCSKHVCIHSTLVLTLLVLNNLFCFPLFVEYIYSI